MFHYGIRLLLLVVAATWTAWSSKDHRAEVGDFSLAPIVVIVRGS